MAQVTAVTNFGQMKIGAKISIYNPHFDDEPAPLIQTDQEFFIKFPSESVRGKILKVTKDDIFIEYQGKKWNLSRRNDGDFPSADFHFEVVPCQK